MGTKPQVHHTTVSPDRQTCSYLLRTASDKPLKLFLSVSTSSSCITADPDKRPDIVGVAALISDRILLHMDNLHREHAILERKLDKERRKTHM